MPAEYTQGDQFRGARIHLCDLSGLEIRDCDVTGLKIVDCYGGNVSLGGGFERVVVNDVDVTAYVEAELDRLHPNRVLAREATSAAEYRAAWDAIEKQGGRRLTVPGAYRRRSCMSRSTASGRSSRRSGIC